MPIIIIHGPPGCGKTRHAAAFLRHYRCTRLVDSWDGRQRLRDGDLALTTMAPPYVNNRANIVDFTDAKFAAVDQGGAR